MGQNLWQVTFTIRGKTCPLVISNELKIPQTEEAKYLGLHLDRRLNRRKHIFIERKQLGIQLSKMYWLLGSRSDESQLSIENKLLLYKAILKPVDGFTVSNFGAQPSIQT